MSLKRRILKISLIVFLSLIGLVLAVNLPLTHFGHRQSDFDYSAWMSETLENEQLITDVAMLGAHDAFSQEIDLFSRLDPYETNGIMQGVTGFLIKGFIVKQSKTQVSDVETLLKSGVRYFDIRLTREEELWYTKHNYLSSDFAPIAEAMVSFLDEHPGEFLILDFQHIDGVDYNDAEDYATFYGMLDDVGLLEFAHEATDLSTLTYGELTEQGAKAKVLITAKFEGASCKVLWYQDAVRSAWADDDDFDAVISFLENEAVLARANKSQLRIMQAVTTMQMSGGGIMNALVSWSLLERAKQFNHYLLETADLEALLVDLPIVMVDYANTNAFDFNDDIMEIIMDFNRNA